MLNFSLFFLIPMEDSAFKRPTVKALEERPVPLAGISAKEDISIDLYIWHFLRHSLNNGCLILSTLCYFCFANNSDVVTKFFVNSKIYKLIYTF